jgi:PAS domain S-box-containing protein
MKRAGLVRQLVIGGAVLAAAVAALLVVMVLAVAHGRSDLRLSRQASDRAAVAQQLEKLVIDTETGLRGYEMTGRALFLQPEDMAADTLPQIERELLRLGRTLGYGIALDRQLVGEVRSYILDYVNPQLTLFSDHPDWVRAWRVVLAGKTRVDAIRAGFAQLDRLDNAHEASLRAATDRSINLVEGAGIGALALGILLFVGFGRRLLVGVVRPVVRLTGAAQRIRSGDLSTPVAQGGAGEVAVLARSLQEMARALELGRDELESQNAELEAQQAELESRQAELELTLEQLSATQAEREAFHYYVARAAAEPDLQRLSEVVLGELLDVADAEVGALYARDMTAPGEPLTLVTTRGLRAAELRQVVDTGTGLAGRAIAERRLMHAAGDAAELRVPTIAGSAVLGSELNIPLVYGDRVVAVVTIGRRNRSPFDPAAVRLLERMAEPAAVAVAGALSLALAEHRAAVTQLVLDSTEDAYIASSIEGLVIGWSDQAERLFGVPRAVALGRELSEVIGSEWDLERAAQMRERLVERARQGTVRERFEQPARHAGGRALLIEYSVVPVQVAGHWQLNIFARDISGRRRQEREIKARALVAEALAGAQSAEPAAAEALAALCEGLGWAPGKLWRAGDAAAPALVQEAIGTGMTKREQSTVALPVGDGLALALELPADEEQPAMLADQAELISAVVGRMVAERESERLKNEFFALVSHELRTPLTSILGYLDIVLEEEAGELSAEQDRFLRVVERNARRLLRLVGDLLFVAQVEAGSLALERGPVEISSVVREAGEAARPRADQGELLLQVDPGHEAIVHGDRDRLGQVLDNLISNAIKFTPAGGIVNVRLRTTDTSAVIEVTDTGMGISQDEPARLFDRFQRAPEAVAAAIPGIGLGLSIVKAIVDGHDGTIEVDSQPGSGTTFRVSLALAGAAVMV